MNKYAYNIQKLININLFFFIIAQILGNFFINLSIILFSLLLIVFFLKDKNSFIRRINNSTILLLTVFFLSITAISLFINKGFNDLNLLRFYFFCLSFYLFSNEIIVCFKKYNKLFFLIIFLVSLDGIIQFFTGINSLGMEKFQGNVTGFFGEEQIIGSFVSKFLIIVLPFVFFSQKKKYEIYFLSLCFFCMFSLIVLSGERRAVIDIIIFLSIFLFFNFKLIKTRYIVSLLIILVFLFNPIKENFFKPVMFQFGFVKKDILSKDTMDKYGVQFYPSIINNVYYAHYMTAIHIWSDNFFVGTGNKGFRKNCGLKKYENLDNEYFKIRCSTHPHNIFLQILSEFGILNFIIFIYLCFFGIFKNFTYKKNSDLQAFLIYFFIIFLPLPSGAILSTSFGSYFWGVLGILLNEKLINK